MALDIAQIDVAQIEVQAVYYATRALMAIGILFAGVVVSKIVKKISDYIVTRLLSKTETTWDDKIFMHITNAGIYLIYAAAVVIAGGQLGVDLIPVTIAVLIFVYAHPVSGLLKVLMERIEKDFVKKTKTRADDFVFPLINKFIVSAVYILAAITAMGQLGLEVTPLLAGLGIGGIALGFAAKDTVADILAGIFIIIDRPFVPGDRIEIWNAPKNSATWGDVIGVGLRSTTIKTTDNIVIVIPNSEIAKRDIINYTAVSLQIRVRIPIGISYESNLKTAEEVLLKIAKNTRGVSLKPVPKVITKEYGESSINLELRIWIDDARTRRRITSNIGKKIQSEFKKNGIEIPYPRRHIIMEGKDGGVTDMVKEYKK
jgi:small conductance mechanosensitive channel